jgi:hypothetical protein
MEIPWTWVVIMTICEICYGGYAIYKEQEISVSFTVGVLSGLWSLCLISWINLHVPWK